ncbi:PolC-type DNA polymerase III [Algoriphagus sp. AK58]|uniref:3'-5' exonuclease n=1 Tax=Algoriphagus sp. AK58 TaxID=1406877 RepID=UPI00164F7A8D|nr:3'-5' exonuclease [Algoriphagus sp. AK58]MBC6368207.1 DNA polymerase III subunit epsilon [Algoriphagus sp. AK58]
MNWWEFWKSGKAKTDFVQSYLEVNAQPIPGIRSIDQLIFTILDTETTGLDPAKDRVLSFGALRIQHGKILINQSVEWYPESEISGKNTVAIHELVEIQNRITTDDFARKFLGYIGSSILVGHHVGFDLEILKNCLKPFGLSYFPNPVIDTFYLAIRLEHGPQADLSRIKRENYSLDALCKKYEIEPDDRHTASGDAFLTALLFIKLLKIARQKGIITYEALLR